MEDLENLVAIFARSPVRGSFKPTRRIADEIRLRTLDYRRFIPERGSFIGRSDYNTNTPLTYICDEQIKANMDVNHVLVDGRRYPIEPPKESTTKMFLRKTGFWPKLEPMYADVITIGLWPGRYNLDGEKYSLDTRPADTGKKTAGTAHFALDFKLKAEDLQDAIAIIKRQPQIVNALIKSLPQGKVSYAVVQNGLTKAVPIDLYRGFMDYGDGKEFKVEVRFRI